VLPLLLLPLATDARAWPVVCHERLA